MNALEREERFNALADQLMEIWTRNGERGQRERIDAAILALRALQQDIDEASD